MLLACLLTQTVVVERDVLPVFHAVLQLSDDAHRGGQGHERARPTGEHVQQAPAQPARALRPHQAHGLHGRQVRHPRPARDRQEVGQCLYFFF